MSGQTSARRSGRAWSALLAASVATVVGSACWLGTVAPGRLEVLPGSAGLAEVRGPAVPTSPAPRASAERRQRPYSARAVPGAAATPRPPGKPIRLLVPRLGVSMPIVASRLDAAGQMALPDRPSEIGWYAYGPRPGAARGSAVLAGHVDSRRFGTGPLVSLRRIRTGDRVVVQTVDGSLTFRVAEVQLVSKRALDLDDVFDRQGRPLLRILTCGGPYRADQGGYQDNVVITAARS